MSLFVGNSGNGLRTLYVEADASMINPAMNAASALMFAKPKQPSRIGLLANSTSASLTILVAHPDADEADVTKRYRLIELPPSTPLNLDTSFGMNLTVDPGTWFFVYVSAGTVNAGEKLRAFFWG